MRKTIVLAALVAALGLAKGAAAQSAGARFDAEYNAGQDALNLSRFEEAWQHFTKARDLAPDKPGPYRMLGRTAREMGQYKDCVDNTVVALRKAPDSRHAPTVLKDLMFCRKKLGRPDFPGEMPEGQGAVAVIANVEGASVAVDGIKKGATPLSPFPVNPGARQVRIERQGYKPIDLEVEVARSVIHDIIVTLEVDPNAPAEGVPTKIRTEVKVGWLVVVVNIASAALSLDGKAVTPAADGTIEGDPGIHTLEVRADGYEPWRRRVVVVRGQKRNVSVTLRSIDERMSNRRWGFVALGAAVAAGAVGAGFGMMENEVFEEARDIEVLEAGRPAYFVPTPDMPEATVHTRQEIDDLVAKGERYALISNISYGVALVALGTSCYFFIQERSAERRGYELPLALVPTVTPGGGASVQVVLTKELDF